MSYQYFCESCKRGWSTRTEMQNCPVCKRAWTDASEQSLVDPHKWPKWARIVKRFRRPADEGVGDTVQRYAATVGGEVFKRVSARIGMPCGCSDRQAEWNRLYQYNERLKD